MTGRPRPRRRALPRLVPALCVLALVAACGSDPPVPVAPPKADARAAAACARLNPALPEKVDKAKRRSTEPGSPLTAAWGKGHVVVLRCGVGRPPQMTHTAQLVTVNDVDWFPRHATGADVFTTIGRAANIELTIPNGYEPKVGPLVDLAAAVIAQLPTVPSGATAPTT